VHANLLFPQTLVALAQHSQRTLTRGVIHQTAGARTYDDIVGILMLSSASPVITFCFPDEHVYWNDIYIQINVYIVGFKNIYDTLKKYFVYRPGTTEAISGAASEPTFTGLETAEAALCNEIIHDAEPWAKTRLRVQEPCLRETKQAASRHRWEEFQAHSCVHWSILPLKWWRKRWVYYCS